MSSSESPKYTLDINEIQNYLPHRYPFLLVDRILEIQPVGAFDSPPPAAQPGTKVLGIKNVSINEPYFQGHFPGRPIMPGVLILESMAQTASFSVYPSLASLGTDVKSQFQCILVAVDSVRFRRPIVPGDTMKIHIEIKKCRGKLWEFTGEVTVDSHRAAEATIMAQLTSLRAN